MWLGIESGNLWMYQLVRNSCLISYEKVEIGYSNRYDIDYSQFGSISSPYDEFLKYLWDQTDTQILTTRVASEMEKE